MKFFYPSLIVVLLTFFMWPRELSGNWQNCFPTEKGSFLQVIKIVGSEVREEHKYYKGKLCERPNEVDFYSIFDYSIDGNVIRMKSKSFQVRVHNKELMLKFMDGEFCGIMGWKLGVWFACSRNNSPFQDVKVGRNIFYEYEVTENTLTLKEKSMGKYSVFQKIE